MVKKTEQEKRILTTCLRCGYIWLPRRKPKVCAECHSVYWDTPRKPEKIKEGEENHE